MRAFQSLINDLNLKNLIPALKHIESKPPLPFYVLKARSLNKVPPQNIGLSITRKLTNQTMSDHTGPFTIWSPYHLHRIAQTKGNRPSNRLILKNPFKSDELLWEAMNFGVTDMVICSLDEYKKIESFKQRNSKFKNKYITYYWTIQNYPDSINEFLPIQTKIGGLFFPIQGNISLSRIDQITQKVLKQGVRIQDILCEGRSSEEGQLQQWKKNLMIWRGQHIQKTIDVIDWSEVENYILATRSLSRRRPVFNEEARQLLKGLDPSESTLLIECGQEQWLLGALNQFPIDQEKYLFDIEVTEQTSKDTPRALSF